MNKKIRAIMIIILFSVAVTGCNKKGQITKLVNDYVEAYNVRDTTACLNLYYMTSEEEEKEKDPDYSGSLQSYFDVNPTTPTYIVRICEIINYGGSGNVLVEQKNSEEDEWESSVFLVVQTGKGFLGYFSEWLIIWALLEGSPPLYIYN